LLQRNSWIPSSCTIIPRSFSRRNQGRTNKSWIDASGKVQLFDGRTGEAFEQDIAIGIMYIMKLHHMVEDKIHMRSSVLTLLLLSNLLVERAQGGGQRLGEMEVWALEGYGASHTA
jgi:DNA-directed RNA polymerase subunit beta